MLPDEVISEIRERVDMVALVGEYVRLVKRGNNHVGLCPFHAEKTPSFNVSAAHKFYHCFGCKESGDALSFLMRIEGVAFPQAVRTLAERVGVQLPESADRPEDIRERQQREHKEQQWALMDEACRFYEAQLSSTKAQVARDELQRRAIHQETAMRFRLGFAPHAWDGLCNHLSAKSHALTEAEGVGLVVKRRDGSGYYDRFRGRLMFPVRELGGKVLAFSGRILPAPEGVALGENEPKYVNSPEGPLYSKGNLLYGLHEARVEVRRNGWAILCEGNFDLIALHQAGFGHAVAPLGTAFTAAQAKLLGRFAERVTLLFDGDAAGQKAMRAAFPILQQQGLRGSVVRLPAGDDPDSYLRKHGAGGLGKLLAEAQGMVEALIDDAAEHSGTSAAERAAAVQGLAPMLQSVSNSVELELYLERVAQRFSLPDTTSVRRQLGRGRGPAARAQPPKRPANSDLAPSAERDRFPRLQRELLGVLLDRPKLFASAHASEVEGLFTSSELRVVLRAAKAAVQESGALDLPALFSALNDSPALPWVKERLALARYQDRDDAEQELEEIIFELAKRTKERELPRLREEIVKASRAGDEQRALQLTRERIELERSAAKPKPRRER